MEIRENLFLVSLTVALPITTITHNNAKQLRRSNIPATIDGDKSPISFGHTSGGQLQIIYQIINLFNIIQQRIQLQIN